MNLQENYFNFLYINSGKIQLIFQTIPIIVGIWHRKILNKPLRLFLIYYCITFTINILEVLFIWTTANYTAFCLPYLHYLGIDSTNFISIFHYLANFGIMGWYFSLVFKPKPISYWINRMSIALFISAFVNYLFIEGYNIYGVFNPLIDSLFSIVLPIIFMWSLFNQMESKVPITKNPYFWVNLRFIVPNLIGLFFYFAGDKLYKTDFILFVEMSIVRMSFFVIGHLFATLAFYYARYTKYLPQNTPSVK